MAFEIMTYTLVISSILDGIERGQVLLLDDCIMGVSAVEEERLCRVKLEVCIDGQEDIHIAII